MQSSSPPAPPDPYKTSAAQTGANINSGIASSWLANPNTTSPVGSWKTSVNRYVNVGGKKVPQFNQRFQFNPGQQRLYNQQLGLGQRMNTIAGQQLGRLQSSLGQPIDFSGAPELAGDFGDYRNEVEAGMMSRLAPQQARDEEATRTRLANMGLSQGSEAWREEMDRLGRGVNDARVQTMLASGGEARAAGAYQNQGRQQYINELMQERNQPLNEIAALMSGGQVSMPGQPNWSSYGVASPDVSGNVYASAALGNQNYAQQMGQQNAMLGGLSSIGGMLAGGFF